ncbi:hypothetical protein HELRODRAFT_187775 [Helobdella robusta]|uniref:Fibronectin type-III domain-containing protein n=1 Tax=Helobdella robusta TaxID=6412 RepID=T1FPD3_HELRO|nr:hypothetical protein HELRODRAFT_187775 [Helobdella robusta]ESO11997.1 hypothetical protein HELRODRAFT_187775 [Helobdella robusta]
MLEKRGSNSFMARWTRLLAEQARGNIAKHKVYFRVYNTNYEKNLIKSYEVPGDSFSYLFDGLDSNGSYQVRVLTATNVGYPTLPDSQWVWVKIHMHNNPVTVQNVSVKLLRELGAKISWKIKKASEIIETSAVYIKYKKVDEVKYKQRYQQHIVNQHVIQFLLSIDEKDLVKIELDHRNEEPDAFTCYMLYISIIGESFNYTSAQVNFSTKDYNDGSEDSDYDETDESENGSHGNSSTDSSADADHKTDIFKAANLSALSVNETSIKVLWSPDFNISSFRFCYVPLVQDIHWVDSCTRCFDGSLLSNLSELYLNELSPMTLYNLYLSAKNRNFSEYFRHDSPDLSITGNRLTDHYDVHIGGTMADGITNITCATRPPAPTLLSCSYVHLIHSFNITWGLPLYQPCYPKLLNYDQHHFIVLYSLMDEDVNYDEQGINVEGHEGHEEAAFFNWSSLRAAGSRRSILIELESEKSSVGDSLSNDFLSEGINTTTVSATNYTQMKTNFFMVKVCVAFLGMTRCSRECRGQRETRSPTAAWSRMKITVTTILVAFALVLLALPLLVFIRKRARSRKKSKREMRNFFKASSKSKQPHLSGRQSKDEVLTSSSGKPLLLMDEQQRISLPPTQQQSTLKTFKPSSESIL